MNTVCHGPNVVHVQYCTVHTNMMSLFDFSKNWDHSYVPSKCFDPEKWNLIGGNNRFINLLIYWSQNKLSKIILLIFMISLNLRLILRLHDILATSNIFYILNWTILVHPLFCIFRKPLWFQWACPFYSSLLRSFASLCPTQWVRNNKSPKLHSIYIFMLKKFGKELSQYLRKTKANHVEHVNNWNNSLS